MNSHAQGSESQGVHTIDTKTLKGKSSKEGEKLLSKQDKSES